jgi:rhamnosyltransferase
MDNQRGGFPRFVVCMAAFNGMAYIREQIDSILGQCEVDVSLVISVDVSTDGTEQFLQEWSGREARIRLLPLGHRFGGAGQNFYRLMRDTQLNGFDYLCFADQDDIWDTNRLLHAHRYLVNTGSHGYSSNFTAFWPTGKEKTVNKASPQNQWDYLFESAGPGCTYVLSKDLAVSFQAAVIKAGTTVNAVIYHDWLCYAYSRANGFSWYIDSWSSIRYRQHENNQIGVNTGWRSFWRRFGKIASGHGFEQARLIALLVGLSGKEIVRRGLSGRRMGYLWLAQNSFLCRRKRLDQIWFLMSCLLMVVLRPKGLVGK